jgi:hypothetical protein
MRIFLRGLTMTAVLLSTTASFAANPAGGSYAGDSDADYYGDEYSESDANESFDNESYHDDNAVRQVSASAYIGDDSAASHPVQPVSTRVASAPQYHAAGFHQHQSMPSYSTACGTSCGSDCDGQCGGNCGTRSKMSKMMCGQCPELWLSAEALLWFPQARMSPALAVVTPAGSVPLIDTPGATIIGEEFGNNLTAGFRGDIGRYFADGHFGLGGRFWILGDDEDSFSLSDDGTNLSIGRPFFNTFEGFEDALFVASQLPGTAGDFVGSISGEASLSIIAAEAYARINLGGGREVHTDLIGGYSYFGIDDDLSITSTSTALSVPGGGTGASRTFRDSFNTTNDFHGGQIGAETILRRGRWVARSLTKLHLGNMNQQVRIAGSASSIDAAGGPVTDFERGFLAINNQGEFERDVYTFAPEVNLKLGYRFRDHVTFSVGYTFIYWNNVALAGQQIDRLIDGGNVDPAANFSPPGPGHDVVDAGFWVQGIDLGATIEF